MKLELLHRGFFGKLVISRVLRGPFPTFGNPGCLPTRGLRELPISCRKRPGRSALIFLISISISSVLDSAHFIVLLLLYIRTAAEQLIELNIFWPLPCSSHHNSMLIVSSDTCRLYTSRPNAIARRYCPSHRHGQDTHYQVAFPPVGSQN